MTTITYISAIRYHQPVWGIEHLRTCLNYAYFREDISRHQGVHYDASDALKFAVMYDHIDYARYLLENHIHEALDSNLCCPVILLAVQHGCREMVEVLCSFANKAKITHKGKPYIDSSGCDAMDNKRTALHISAELGNEDITKTLLQYGADVNVTDKNGLTPLQRLIKKCVRESSSNISNTRTRRHDDLSNGPLRLFIRHRRTSRSRSPVGVSVSGNEPNSRGPDRSWHNILQLLNCQTTVSKCDVDNLNEVCRRKHGHLDGEQCLQFPFSLMHHSRLAIRKAIGKARFPESVYELGLPYKLERFVDLQPMLMEVTSENSQEKK